MFEDLNVGLLALLALARRERRIKMNEALGNEKLSCHDETSGDEETGERIQLGQPDESPDVVNAFPDAKLNYSESVARARAPQ